jgi:hypothetical protein
LSSFSHISSQSCIRVLLVNSLEMPLVLSYVPSLCVKRSMLKFGSDSKFPSHFHPTFTFPWHLLRLSSLEKNKKENKNAKHIQVIPVTCFGLILGNPALCWEQSSHTDMFFPFFFIFSLSPLYFFVFTTLPKRSFDENFVLLKNILYSKKMIMKPSFYIVQ